MGVKLQSSSGGSVEIAAPVTASNYTLTAPAATGTILNDQSSLAAANLTGDVAAARITNALNASGSAPVYACRAWVNFNGTGTVAIRASGNVSSITDNGTGNYTVNFATAMPDANYSVVGTLSNSTYSTVADNSLRGLQVYASGQAAGNVQILTRFQNIINGAAEDQSSVFVSIFR